MVELAGIVILGIIAQWSASKLRIPAILPLILIGLAVGPISTLFTPEGHKLIEPMWNPEAEHGLFPGHSLFYFVSLAISIILFEGGLTLRRGDILNVEPVIVKMVSIGVLITFIAAGAAAHWVFSLSWQISFLFSALVFVTGPTVIGPILRHVPLKKDLSAVLRWEAILIDPLGALVAVLVFGFISVGQGQGEYTWTAIKEFGKILLFGFTFGFAFAHGLAFLIKKRAIPNYLFNVVTLACVLAVFVLADLFAHESGLLAVVVMGIILGNSDLPNLKSMFNFKESLSILLVSILFILLAANMDMEDLKLIYTWQSAALFGILVFVIRPLAVFVCTKGSGLEFRDKIFVSWVGPRGIVAAGISSLFGMQLARQGVPGAHYITPLVFMIVLGTVILNALTARPFAKLLGIFLRNAEGILIIGSSQLSRLIATYLKKNNRHVVLIDNNHNNIRHAKELGIPAIEGSIYSDNLTDNIQLNDIGYLMALTGNSEINNAAIDKFKDHFGEKGTFRVVSADEMTDPENNPKEGLFSQTDDYIRLSQVSRRHPHIREVKLNSQKHYQGLIEITKTEKDIIPLFVKDNKGNFSIIPSDSQAVEIDEGFILVYLGREIENKEPGPGKNDDSN